MVVAAPASLTSAAFKSTNGNQTVTLTQQQLSALSSNGLIKLAIVNNKITGVATAQNIPFPFNLTITYNGAVIQSLTIGGNASNPVPGNNGTTANANQNTGQQAGGTGSATTAAAPAIPVNLINGSVNTGIDYYDAMSIKALMQGPSKQPLYSYLQKFYFKNDTIKTIVKLRSLVADNIYLTNAFAGIRDSSVAAAESGASSLVSSIGGLDVTNIANGMAQFMITRAKQELTIAFFNRFKTYAAKHPEFQILFPQTTSNLSNLLSYNYPNMLPALRSGFYSDLHGIAGRMDGVLAVPECDSLLKNLPEVKVALRTVTLIDSISNKKLNPAQAVNSFTAFQEFNGQKIYPHGFQNFSNSARLAGIFSKALNNADTTSKNGWITPQALTSLLTDNTNLNIFLGLIELQAKQQKIIFYTDTIPHNIAPLLDKPAGGVKTFTSVLKNFLTIASQVDATAKQIRYNQSNHLATSNDDIFNYVNSTITVLESGFGIANSFGSHINLDSSYVAIARETDILYRDIYKDQYAQAMLNAIDIIKKSVATVKVTPANQAAITKLSNVINDINGYGLFIANLTEAKSSDEVQAVIDNAVLPVGSSSVKKNSNLNLAFQSYLGARLTTGSVPGNVNSAWSDKVGISAPIGIALSHGFDDNWGSITLFGSLFDIGAIVDYQLKKDSLVNSNGKNTSVTNKSYQVKLGQILSPGGFIVYGFGGNIPLSLGFGYQYGPGLGKINSDGTTVVGNPVGRWGAFLSVDIPLFNIFNKIKPITISGKK